ncbi:MAG: sodium/glutamate symporter [Alphaproteobacteria bacterium]|nr:sodium/glutamate symporter [Alphaproteobacteria bacterium]
MFDQVVPTFADGESVLAIGGVWVLLVSLAALILGEGLIALSPALKRLSVPSAVLGGLAVCLITALLDASGWATVAFSPELRDIAALILFSAIGLSIKARRILASACAVGLLLGVAAALLVFQDMVGSAVAASLGAHPGYGLLAGSISFMGGHGTGVAWGAILSERYSIDDAEQVALVFATLGLLAGGLLGGPVAQHLIRKHGLSGKPDEEGDGQVISAPIEAVRRFRVRPTMLTAALLILLGAVAAPPLSALLAGLGVTLPPFALALVAGAVLSNLADAIRLPTDPAATGVMRDLSLQIFIVMSVMSIQLGALTDLVGPLLLVCLLQIVMVLFFVYFSVFHILGRSYEAAVMCGGLIGFGLGATFVGLANMRAVTTRHGPAPVAFIAVPIVGAFLIDLVNALVLQLYLLSTVLE